MERGPGTTSRPRKETGAADREERLRTFLKLFFDLPSSERQRAIDFWRETTRKALKDHRAVSP